MGVEGSIPSARFRPEIAAGYEVTGADVVDAYRATLAAAERQGRSAEVTELILKTITGERTGGFVTKVLARELGL